MHFVEDLAFEFHAGPGGIGPVEGGWIDYLRCRVRTFGLEAGSGIGKAVAAIQAVFVSGAGFDTFGQAGKISTAVWRKRNHSLPGTFDCDFHAAPFWGPDAEVDCSSWRQVCAHGDSPLYVTLYHLLLDSDGRKDFKGKQRNALMAGPDIST